MDSQKNIWFYNSSSRNTTRLLKSFFFLELLFVRETRKWQDGKGEWKNERKGRGRERGKEKRRKGGRKREESNRLAPEIQLQSRIERELLEEFT